MSAEKENLPDKKETSRLNRELEARVANYRKTYTNLSASQYDIPNKHPDYDYYWFAEYVNHELVPGDRMAEARNNEWELVTPDEVPEWTNKNTAPWREKRKENYIMRGGLVAHKRHKAFGKAEEEENRKILKSKVGALPFANRSAYPTGVKVGRVQREHREGFMEEEIS
jgi:hypothetical protein